MKVKPFEAEGVPRPDDGRPEDPDRRYAMHASPDAEGAGSTGDEEPPEEPGYGHGV